MVQQRRGFTIPRRVTLSVGEPRCSQTAEADQI
jgi:hypothetical protein